MNTKAPFVFLALAVALSIFVGWHRQPRYIVVYTYSGDRIQFTKAMFNWRTRDMTEGWLGTDDGDGPAYDLSAEGGVLRIPRNFEGIDAVEVIHDDPAVEHEYAKLRIHFHTGRVVIGFLPLNQPPLWDIVEGETAEGYEQVDLCRVDRIDRE